MRAAVILLYKEQATVELGDIITTHVIPDVNRDIISKF